MSRRDLRAYTLLPTEFSALARNRQDRRHGSDDPPLGTGRSLDRRTLKPTTALVRSHRLHIPQRVMMADHNTGTGRGWNSWLRNLRKRIFPATRRSERPAQRNRRPRIETLEDRTLMSISPILDVNGHDISFLGVAGDNLWLKTDGSGNLLYSSDGSNYSAAGTNLTSANTKITLGAMDSVHLAGLNTAGQALTIQSLAIPNGNFGSLAGPGDVDIDSNITTQGGDLSIINVQGIDVGA